MFEQLLAQLFGNTEHETRSRADMARLAVTVLLVEAARADDAYQETERRVIRDVLIDLYALSPGDAAELLSEGEAAQMQAVDLVRFTRAIKDGIPPEGRIAVIEALWRVIYADGKRSTDEAALIRRLCGLLYISDQDAGLARQRVLNALPQA